MDSITFTDSCNGTISTSAGPCEPEELEAVLSEALREHADKLRTAGCTAKADACDALADKIAG